MLVPVLFSIAVGIFTVLQGGMNKEVSMQYGVAGATLINSLFVLVFSILIFAVVNYTKLAEFPAYLKLASGAKSMKWWYFIPGIFGCLIVFGIPYGIINIGALKTMTLMICAQVIASILWDFKVEQIPVSQYRILGGLLTMAGAFLVSFKA